MLHVGRWGADATIADVISCGRTRQELVSTLRKYIELIVENANASVRH
jgi:hypothetical protein